VKHFWIVDCIRMPSQSVLKINNMLMVLFEHNTQIIHIIEGYIRNQKIHTFSFGNTRKYQEIPKNFRKNLEISGNTCKFQEILGNIKKYY
jgi:hypothetical protein